MPFRQYLPRPLVMAGLIALGAATTGCAGGSQSNISAAQLQTNQPGDANLTCDQIRTQISEMNDILGIAENDTRTFQAMGLAQDAAINAALYSGALGSAASSVPFLGQAISVMGSVQNMNQQEKERLAQQAANRRNVLTGIYAGKNCS